MHEVDVTNIGKELVAFLQFWTVYEQRFELEHYLGQWLVHLQKIPLVMLQTLMLRFIIMQNKIDICCSVDSII